MINILGAFTDVFVNPVAAALVVALGFLLHRRWAVRVSAAMIGIAWALPEASTAHGLLEGMAHVTGGAFAALLQAELVLHFVMPAWHLGLSLLAAAWQLACSVIVLLLPGRERGPPEEPKFPPGDP